MKNEYYKGGLKQLISQEIATQFICEQQCEMTMKLKIHLLTRALIIAIAGKRKRLLHFTFSYKIDTIRNMTSISFYFATLLYIIRSRTR